MTAYSTAGGANGAVPDANGVYDGSNALAWTGGLMPPLTVGTPMVTGDTLAINHRTKFLVDVWLGRDPTASPGATYPIALGANGMLVADGCTIHIRDSASKARFTTTTTKRNDALIALNGGGFLWEPASGVRLTFDQATSSGQDNIAIVGRGTSYTNLAFFGVDTSRGGTAKFNSDPGNSSRYRDGGYVDLEYAVMYGWEDFRQDVRTPGNCTGAGTWAPGDALQGPLLKVYRSAIGKDKTGADVTTWCSQTANAATTAITTWHGWYEEAWIGNSGGVNDSNFGAKTAAFSDPTDGVAVAVDKSASGVVRLVKDTYFKDAFKLHRWRNVQIKGRTIIASGVMLAKDTAIAEVDESVLLVHRGPGQYAIQALGSGSQVYGGGYWAGGVIWSNANIYTSDQHGIGIYGVNAAGVNTNETWTRRLYVYSTCDDGGHNGMLYYNSAGAGLRNITITNVIMPPFRSGRAFEPMHAYASLDTLRVEFKNCTFCGCGDSTVMGMCIITSSNAKINGLQDCIIVESRTGLSDVNKGRLLYVAVAGVTSANLPTPTHIGHNLKVGMSQASVAGSSLYMIPVVGGDAGGYFTVNTTEQAALTGLGIGAGDVALANVTAIGFRTWGFRPTTYMATVAGLATPTTDAADDAVVTAFLAGCEKWWTDRTHWDARYDAILALNALYDAYAPSAAIARTMSSTGGYVGAVAPASAVMARRGARAASRAGRRAPHHF